MTLDAERVQVWREENRDHYNAYTRAYRQRVGYRPKPKDNRCRDCDALIGREAIRCRPCARTCFVITKHIPTGLDVHLLVWEAT